MCACVQLINSVPSSASTKCSVSVSGDRDNARVCAWRDALWLNTPVSERVYVRLRKQHALETQSHNRVLVPRLQQTNTSQRVCLCCVGVTIAFLCCVGVLKHLCRGCNRPNTSQRVCLCCVGVLKHLCRGCNRPTLLRGCVCAVSVCSNTCVRRVDCIN
jgi:hypothetical protein